MPPALYGNTIPGLSIPEHDHIKETRPSPGVQQYTYRQGGSGGAIVCIVTLETFGDGTIEVTRS